MISQRFLRQRLGAVRQQAITRGNAGPGLERYMLPLGHIESNQTCHVAANKQYSVLDRLVYENAVHDLMLLNLFISTHLSVK